MAKPLVAIVGRPNVGKSMLFNKLTGQRTSIVEDTPGVTRDRIYGDCEWCGRHFSLVDTGGIEPDTDSDMLKFMRRQAEIGIELADAIIMVADVRSGVTAADQDVATMLRKSGKPVALAVNKCDSIGPVNADAFEFYSLGIGDLFETSAIHGPARIPPEKAAEIQAAAKTIYRALDCRVFARVDLFLTPDGEIVFNEVNTIPGFTAHSRYPSMMQGIGISFGELVTRLIELGVAG